MMIGGRNYLSMLLLIVEGRDSKQSKFLYQRCTKALMNHTRVRIGVLDKKEISAIYNNSSNLNADEINFIKRLINN